MEVDARELYGRGDALEYGNAHFLSDLALKTGHGRTPKAEGTRPLCHSPSRRDAQRRNRLGALLIECGD